MKKTTTMFWALMVSLGLFAFHAQGGSLPITHSDRLAHSGERMTMPVDRDLPRYSDIASSFILIGLGGFLLIFHRWASAHSPQPDPYPSLLMNSAGTRARSRNAD